MDDSSKDNSQNTPEAPPTPPAENNGYQQYIDPNKKPKDQRKIILFAAIGVVVFLVLVVTAIAIGTNKQDDKQGPVQGVTVICEDEVCFQEKFSLCQPAKYQESEDANTAEYELPGIQDIGCIVSVRYLESDDPDLVGREMTCDFDNDIDFYASAELVFANPEDFECEGTLLEYL